MYRVIFTSRASSRFGRETLTAINAVSRRNNFKLAVSGLLVFHDRRFFQVLEGEEAVLSSLMARIAIDPRHVGLDIVHHGASTQRAFATWRLCCACASPAETPYAGAVALQDLIPSNSRLRGRDPQVRQQVRSFLAGLAELPARATG
jgi:hypothetical protein